MTVGLGGVRPRYVDLLSSLTLAAVAEAHRGIWTRVLQTVPDGAAALVIGRGGGIEPALVACLPGADHESPGCALPTATGPPQPGQRPIRRHPIPLGPSATPNSHPDSMLGMR
jgi:hypothetical protein